MNKCGRKKCIYGGDGTQDCYGCSEIKGRGQRKPTPYERTRAAVYATGNKWAIENFNATHN